MVYRGESEADACLDHAAVSGLAGVFDVTIEDGIAHHVLDVADGSAGLEVEGFHDVPSKTSTATQTRGLLGAGRIFGTQKHITVLATMWTSERL